MLFSGLTDRGEYGQTVQERRGYIPFESVVVGVTAVIDDEATTDTGVIADRGRLDFHLLREAAYQVLLEPVQLLRGQPGPVLPVQYIQVDRDLPYGLHRPGAALFARGHRGHPGGRQVLRLGGQQAGLPDRTAAGSVVHVHGVHGVHVALDAEEYQRAGERVRHEQGAYERVPQTALVALALGVGHAGPFHAVVVAVATETSLAVVHHRRHATDRRRRRRGQRAAVVRRGVTADRRTGHTVVVHGRRRGHRLRTARRRPVHGDAAAAVAAAATAAALPDSVVTRRDPM